MQDSRTNAQSTSCRDLTEVVDFTGLMQVCHHDASSLLASLKRNGNKNFYDLI